MSEEKPSILRAIWRLITFYKYRAALGWVHAANKQFTGSIEGVRAAYEMEKNKLVNEFKQMRDAVSQVEVQVETDRNRLNDLNVKEEELIKKRDGAIVQAEKAKAAGDNDAYMVHEAAFTRFQTAIKETEEKQAQLEKQISEREQAMKKYMLKLTEMQAAVKKLPEEQADAIADWVSNQKIIELNDRLSNMKTSFESGPIDEVRKFNKELSAKAKISEKLAGTDVVLQDQEYAAEGAKVSAKDELSQILAARKTEKKAKEEAGAATETKDKREKI